MALAYFKDAKLRAATVASLMLVISTVLFAAAKPDWWAERGAVNLKPADDFAVANIGQLKQIASKARDELDAWLLPDGAGPEIKSLIERFGINLTQLPGVTANQSSTAFGGLASRGIDNNTDGDYNHASVTHTEGAVTAAGTVNSLWQDPWWQVDLGASRTIHTIELWNRTDNQCGSRLANFYVFVSETSMAQTSLKTLLASSSVWKSAKVAAPPSPNIRLNAGSRRGRYVMIRVDGPQYLHLAELKVYGAESPTAAPTDDFAALTLGQLKTVAKPFYDRLSKAGYNAPYPWQGRELAADDLALANIGQLKSIFSFDVRPLDSIHDSNRNGIPDWWENLYLGHLINNPNDDKDGDGIPDAQEYLAGGNPNASDTDHDGISDAEELALGTNPKESDTDNDGVKDKLDLYPTDRRRSSDIPVLRYAVIDVSTAITKNDDIEMVAVDDSNKIGFVRTNAQSTDGFSVPLSALGTPVIGTRLPMKFSPPYQKISENDVNFLLREEYRYNVRGINADGRFVVDITLHATLCREWADGDPSPPPSPPIPGMTGYPILVTETSFIGVSTWLDGAMPMMKRVSVSPYLSYEMQHLGYFGKGIANGGIFWGRDGEDDFNTFIGDSLFGGASGAANIPGFDFGIGQISQNAKVAAGKIKGPAGLPYTAYWKDNTFRPVFSIEDSETEVQLVDDKAEMFGFSRWLSPQLYFSHLEPEARHPFWYVGNNAVDFYIMLPKEFQQQVVFLYGDRGIVANSAGDMLFYAHVADSRDGEPIWREAFLLWEVPKNGRDSQLREVEFPEGFEVKQMTPKLAMAGLAKQPKLDQSGSPIPDPSNPKLVLKTRRAALLLPCEILVDANRDRKMSFTDPAIHGGDLTAVEKPYQFWLNNDYDKGGSVDLDDTINSGPGDHWEEDDQEGDHDRNDGVIEWMRDLEDFTRLWITFKGITELISQPDVAVELKFEPSDGISWRTADGDPKIRIFKAVERDGGRKYLEDANVSWLQLDSHQGPGGQRDFSKEMGIVTKLGACQLSKEFLKDLSETDPNRYLLFEGLEAGKGALMLTVKVKGKEIAKYPAIYLELKDVKDMYEQWSVGEVAQPGVQYSAWPSLDLTPLYGLTMKPMVAPYDETKDYILYVHGWNMKMSEKGFYSDTAFKRLWHEGYKGRFGSFRWPTFWFADSAQGGWTGPGSIYVPIIGSYVPSPKHFDGSEHRAWVSSAGLLKLFNQINRSKFKGNIRVFAHSMGNIVVSEALHRSKSGQVVDTYIASQAALSANFYDAAAPPMSYVYRMGPDTPDVYSHYHAPTSVNYMSPNYMNGKAGEIFNYFNPQDWALDWPRWQLNQQLKPDDNYKYDGQLSGVANYDSFFHLGKHLYFVDDTHEIFAWAAESRSYALGGQWVQGIVSENVDLSVRPIRFARAHKWHSGQFRGTYIERREYWKRMLKDFKLKS
ncbi:MAG: hypothetical protein JWL90_445 [Chthoniobacteraceae bacterium]|nr:hypothetical protein [Chthoniobacteraceae bacterium]